MRRKALLTLAAIVRRLLPAVDAYVLTDRPTHCAAQTDATGESDHTQLEEIEIIFGAFEEIDALALRQCRSLQRLTRKCCANGCS